MKLPQISKVTTGVILGLGMLAVSAPSQAAPLNLTLSQPDILSSFLDVNYYSSSNTLDVSGFSDQIANSGINSIALGNFNLSAAIDGTGALSGGTVAITGTVNSLGFTSGTLLTGNLTAFGFGNAGAALEFVFDVTGGDAASLYGSTGGIILGGSGFTGDFTGDWNNTGGSPGFGTGTADVGAVAIPAAAWLFGSGLLGLVGVARRSPKV